MSQSLALGKPSVKVHDALVNVIPLIITFVIVLGCLGESLERLIFCYAGKDANQSQNQWVWKQNSDWESHTPTRTKNTNFIELWSEMLYIGALSPICPNCHVYLAEEEIMLSVVPSAITISHSTYWAGLHLCWSMTKEYGWICCPSPDLCVIRPWGFSSGLAGRHTQAGTFWCICPQRKETQICSHCSRTSKHKG